MSPPRDPAPDAPSAPPKKDGSVVLGILLAVVWVFLWFAVSAVLDSLAYGHPIVELAGFWVYLVVNLGSLVAVHVYAIRGRKPRILVGFWGALSVGVLIFLVTCFTLIWAYTSGG